MKRLLWLAILLVAGAAQAQSLVPGIAREPGSPHRVLYVEFPSTTTAGVYRIGDAFTMAVLDFELGSAFSGVLYACDTSTGDSDGDGDLSDEAGCTSLATLSADTSLSSMQARKRYYVIDINTAESAGNTSRLTIKGTWDQVAASGGANAPFDSDGDGLTDSVVVRGDYNGDGSQDIEDIYDAANALTDTGPRYVEVQGVYDSSAMDEAADFDWDLTRLVSLPANTTLQCAPQTRLYGPSLAFWRDRSTNTYLIANADGADNVTVRGCFIENTELIEPFDANTSGTDWQVTSLFGGVFFGSCEGCLAEGNTVRGSPHAGFFMTRSSNTTFLGNVAYGVGEAFNHEGTVTTLAATEPEGETSLDLTATLGNCAVDDWILIELDETDPLAKPGTTRQLWAAGWVEATGDPITIRRSSYASGRNPGLPSVSSGATATRRVFCSGGDKQAFETYTEDDAGDASGVDYVASGNSISFNQAELVSNIAFQIRGVNTSADECEDGTEVTCWHENTTVRGNTATDVGGELVQVRGSRGAIVDGNTGIRTGGVTFTLASQPCSQPYDDSSSAGDQRECTIDTTLRGNLIRDCAPNSGNGAATGACVRFNGGHERITWESSNFIDGTVAGNAFAIMGDSVGSALHMAARNVEASCLIDSLNTADPLTRPLYGSLNCTNVGLGYHTVTPANAPAVAIRDNHTAPLTLDPFVVSGVVAGWLFIDPIGAEDILAPSLYNLAVDGSWSGYSGTYATLSALDAAVECSPAWEGVTAIIQDAASASDCTTGGGSTENWCLCDGSDFVNADPLTTRDGLMVLSGNDVNSGGLYGGVVTNTLANNVSAVNLQSSTGTTDGFEIKGVTFRKGEEGMLTADAMRGVEEQAGSVTNLTIQNVSFDGITDANRYINLEPGDYSGDSQVVDTGLNPSTEACNPGTMLWNLGAAGTGTIEVCQTSGTWAPLD